MSSCKIVSSVFLARNELFWVEKLSVSTSPHFIDHSRLQIYKYTSRYVLSRTSLAEESIEGIVRCPDRVVTVLEDLGS